MPINIGDKDIVVKIDELVEKAYNRHGALYNAINSTISDKTKRKIIR